MGLTTGIRYSACRRQFSNPMVDKTNTGLETAVIEYQLQQQRLLPYLAGSIPILIRLIR